MCGRDYYCSGSSSRADRGAVETESGDKKYGRDGDGAMGYKRGCWGRGSKGMIENKHGYPETKKAR